MKKSVFNELLKSVQQMDAIAKGKQKPNRECSIATLRSDEDGNKQIDAKEKSSGCK